MVFSQWFNDHRILKQLAKALIRLRICAGWSEALLVAHTTLLEISCTGSYTHANKKKATPIHGLFENKYRYEHIMITNVYIVSHILDDHHLYERILGSAVAQW